MPVRVLRRKRGHKCQENYERGHRAHTIARNPEMENCIVVRIHIREGGNLTPDVEGSVGNATYIWGETLQDI